jgi:uncharacterized membrane protein YraQ (UPF0718 family)
MNWKEEYKPFLWILGFFLLVYYLPVGAARFDSAVNEALALVKWYAREHVLFCLVPAFFIAGAIAVFVSQAAVIKYFGAGANKWLAYLVASVSGTILAVCSCTVLPLFSGIHKRGAGLGPAIAFLYSGPAINVLAIILTARILGLELGVARVVGAVSFSVIIGLAMHLIYRKEEAERASAQLMIPEDDKQQTLAHTALQLATLIAILVFANWGQPEWEGGIWSFLYAYKWWIAAGAGILFAGSLTLVLKLKKTWVAAAVLITAVFAVLFPEDPRIPFAVAVIGLGVLLSLGTDQAREWMGSSWGFTKQIMPLLGAGVLVAGFLLGAPGGQGGIIPGRWIASLVGGNSFSANLFASVVGAFMYFATLTEVPILQGLIGSGMGKGPALALLLAGPALSLPNMLVIRSVIGTQKTLVFVALVVVMATVSGLIYGSVWG